MQTLTFVKAVEYINRKWKLKKKVITRGTVVSAIQSFSISPAKYGPSKKGARDYVCKYNINDIEKILDLMKERKWDERKSQGRIL